MTTWTAASDGASLLALVDAIKRSPIVVRSILTSSSALLREWTAVRKTNRADAFVLAWIASHARGPRRGARVLN